MYVYYMMAVVPAAVHSKAVVPLLLNHCLLLLNVGVSCYVLL